MVPRRTQNWNDNTIKFLCPPISCSSPLSQPHLVLLVGENNNNSWKAKPVQAEEAQRLFFFLHRNYTVKKEETCSCNYLTLSLISLGLSVMKLLNPEYWIHSNEIFELQTESWWSNTLHKEASASCVCCVVLLRWQQIAAGHGRLEGHLVPHLWKPGWRGTHKCIPEWRLQADLWWMNDDNPWTFWMRQSFHPPPPSWVWNRKKREEEVKANIKYLQSSRGWQIQTRQHPRHACSLAQK